MKKVRFATPSKMSMDTMREYECHSPRPFIGRQVINIGTDFNQPRPLVFTNDPVHKFDNGNSSPYPIVNKTHLETFRQLKSKNVPTSDLDLSILDSSRSGNMIQSPKVDPVYRTEPNGISPYSGIKKMSRAPHNILKCIENKTTELQQPPNMLSRDNDFFLKRENMGEISLNTLECQFKKISLSEDATPLRKKNDLMKIGTLTTISEKENCSPRRIDLNGDCKCHHCSKIVSHTHHTLMKNNNNNIHTCSHIPRINYSTHNCTATPRKSSCNCSIHLVQPICHCKNHQHPPLSPQNAVEKKTWAIEKYEKTREAECSEVEKPNAIVTEKREPTVADLFKIIKLQNEQLQLLQEKVDKFISSHHYEVHEKQTVPINSYVTEQMAVQTVNSEQHKISIGVMTSFEMVRTSTVINKEIVKQCEAQIQCNRSQISIKEFVAKKQSGNMNFLDGISPVSNNIEQTRGTLAQPWSNVHNNESHQANTINNDKTLNELSLYNVQVDNATTPLMSPEQSLYLDIRDYSESDSGSDDQSNVGWTYYNKVMTHVNGMLQDSDMPSSASALHRHTKQKCLQMQIDKSNVSVGKRVTFGDDPLGVQQHHIPTPTDTSLKMNQLAAKYLKNTPASHIPKSPRPTAEMSFATRNYMERHKLLQGQHSPIHEDLPRFLDITALKQQPKL